MSEQEEGHNVLLTPLAGRPIAISDVVMGGSIFYWRNPADKPFGKEDKWQLERMFWQPNQILELYQDLKKEVDELAAHNRFAYNEEFGYLSPFLNHCGLGMGVAFSMHLDALSILGEGEVIDQSMNAVRFSNGLVDERDIRRGCPLVHYASTCSLGYTEIEFVSHCCSIATGIACQEVYARHELVNHHPLLFEDAIQRALATLRSCVLLPAPEAIELLCPLHLAASLNFLKGISLEEIVHMLPPLLGEFVPQEPESPEADAALECVDHARADSFNKMFQRVTLSARGRSYLHSSLPL